MFEAFAEEDLPFEHEETRKFVRRAAVAKRVPFCCIVGAIFAGMPRAEILAATPETLSYFVRGRRHKKAEKPMPVKPQKYEPIRMGGGQWGVGR